MKTFTPIFLITFVAVVSAAPSGSSGSGSGSNGGNEAVQEKPHGIFTNVMNAVDTAGDQAKKYGEGVLDFFGTGAKEAGNAAVNAFQDAGDAAAKTIGALLGNKNFGNAVANKINAVGNGVKNVGDNIIGDGERVGTGVADEVERVTNNLTGNENKGVSSAYYSAFN